MNKVWVCAQETHLVSNMVMLRDGGGAGEKAQQLRARGLRFDTQHQHGNSQLPLTPLPRDLTLRLTSASTMHAHGRQKHARKHFALSHERVHTHTHILEILIKICWNL